MTDPSSGAAAPRSAGPPSSVNRALGCEKSSAWLNRPRSPRESVGPGASPPRSPGHDRPATIARPPARSVHLDRGLVVADAHRRHVRRRPDPVRVPRARRRAPADLCLRPVERVGVVGAGEPVRGHEYRWWQHKHTKHHSNPNKIDADPDIDMVVLAFTPEQAVARRQAAGETRAAARQRVQRASCTSQGCAGSSAGTGSSAAGWRSPSS